jgi:peptide/nickel transport system substrate-binding protein
VKDDHLLLKRNENYWNKGGGPYLDQIRYRPIPDDVVKLQSLQSGEIDVMDYVQPRDVAAVKADRNVVVLDVPSLASFAYQLNHTKPPFNNKALRQALAYAVDTEQIVKGVWLNVGVPSNGPIPPTSWAYDATIKPIRRDLAKVKAKLAEAGQPNGFAFTMTTANIPINAQEAEVIQAQLAEAGITMKIKLVDASTQLSDGNNKNFEMISYQWSGRRTRTATPSSSSRRSPGTSLNWSGISNPRSTLLDKSRSNARARPTGGRSSAS